MSDGEQTDEELLQLSPATLELLQDFRFERLAQANHLEELRAQHYSQQEVDDKLDGEDVVTDQDHAWNVEAGKGPTVKTIETKTSSTQRRASLSMKDFPEDWNASQFWYDSPTAQTFAKALLQGITPNCNVVVISTPSVYIALRNLLDADSDPIDEDDNCHEPSVFQKPNKLTLLEFDLRFSNIFEDDAFVHYDFRHPLRLPQLLKGTADCIICDPPFLSEECQTAISQTIRWLLREPFETDSAEAGQTKGFSQRIIISTGRLTESFLLPLYSGWSPSIADLQITTYSPKHEQRRLTNEWGCYANFEYAGDGEGPGWTFSSTDIA